MLFNVDMWKTVTVKQTLKYPQQNNESCWGATLCAAATELSSYLADSVKTTGLRPWKTHAYTYCTKFMYRRAR